MEPIHPETIIAEDAIFLGTILPLKAHYGSIQTHMKVQMLCMHQIEQQFNEAVETMGHQLNGAKTELQNFKNIRAKDS